MSTPWNLISSGQYDAAIDAYSVSLEGSPDAPTYRNRATALLLRGRFAEAISDIEAAEAIDSPAKAPGRFHGDADQIRLGVIEWLKGEPEKAAKRWLVITEALLDGRVAYSDASGGVGAASLLRFAAVRLCAQEFRPVSDQLIEHLLKRSRLSGWPLPIGEYLSGRIEFDALRSKVTGPDLLRHRRLCQVHFAAAVMRLEAGDAAGYRSEMSIAASFKDAVLEDEYFLATHEAPSAGA